MDLKEIKEITLREVQRIIDMSRQKRERCPADITRGYPAGKSYMLMYELLENTSYTDPLYQEIKDWAPKNPEENNREYVIQELRRFFATYSLNSY